MTGGTTHIQLVPLPQVFAWGPLVAAEEEADTLALEAGGLDDEARGAVALGVPVAESSAWQPLAEVPAVQ